MALEQLEHDLQEVNANKDALKKNYLELQELRHILTKATQFFEEVCFLFLSFCVTTIKTKCLVICLTARSNSKHRVDSARDGRWRSRTGSAHATWVRVYSL